MRDKSELLGAPERRTLPVTEFELREDGDSSLTLTGYASVFNTPYEVWGGPERGGWNEIVDRKAFDKTLSESPDVHLLVNHGGMPLARTKSGTLQLSTDRTGLKVHADLDAADPDVVRLRTKMKRGDMDQMSFAFRTVRQEWNDDESERRLLEVNINRGDVSVVNFGANPATSSQLRSALGLLAELQVTDDVLAELRSVDTELFAKATQGLSRACRAATPAEKRTMTLADARKLLDAAV